MAKAKKTGPQGVVLILFGLALWRSATVAGDSSRREYVSVLEDVAWVMSELVKNSVPFAQRDRPARSLQPAADVPTAADTPDGNTARRTSRESRPTKRKLGLSDLDPSAASHKAKSKRGAVA